MKRQELHREVPMMKKSDSSYLRKRFQVIANKGLDNVRRDKIHGSNHQIEMETL